MKKMFTEEQIIGILKQQENGVPVKEIIRKYNICEQTFYRWKSKYGGMEVSEAKRLRQLEGENKRLKILVADLTLDRQALQWVIEKNELSLPAKKK
jgi:putative transposase